MNMKCKKNSKYKRNEKLLVVGTWTSKVGDVIFDYVNNVILVHAFANKSWILALYQSSDTVIRVIFNMFGGIIADIGERKKILIVTDCISAGICFVTSYFVSTNIMALALIIGNALLALIFSFSSPAYKSIVSDMVEKGRISVYNSIINAGQELINVVGPFIGFVFLKAIGAKGALIINGITFLISAFLEIFLIQINASLKEEVIHRNKIFYGIKEGIVYLYSEKMILYLLIISAFVNFFLAGYNLLLPYTDLIYNGMFSGFYSKAMMAEAVGGIIGSIANAKLPQKAKEKYTSLLCTLGATGVTLIFIAIAKITYNIILCLSPFFLFGAFLTIYNINFMTYVQTHVDEKYLGRVFSVIFTVAVMFMPVGSFVFSAVNITKYISGFSIIGIGIVLLSIIFYVIGKISQV